MIVQNPWEPPKDIDRLIDDLIAERKTYLVQRAYNPWDQNDAHKARAQIEEIKGALKPLLICIYTYTSNAFHVLLKRLIPRADKNYLFTRIKGARMEHILRRREWEESRQSAALPALSDEEKLQHSAAHTLKFIQAQYVDADDDALHTTWDRTLKSTREPKTSLYTWVDSVHTAKKLSKRKRIKINKIIAKQITEDEKLLITTINSTFTSAYINDGDYILGDLINLLAQHTSNFAAKRCIPHEHPRIITYLKIRARSSAIPLPNFISWHVKPTTSSTAKRRRVQPPQRAWTYLMNGNSPATQTSPRTSDKGTAKDKGKGMSKGKSLKGKPSVSYKGKFKGKGKNTSWTKGKGKPKGNCFCNVQACCKNDSGPLVLLMCWTVCLYRLSWSMCWMMCLRDYVVQVFLKVTVLLDTCVTLDNCRQYQALRNSPSYQARLSHPARTQLIYDHLEDAVYVCSTFMCNHVMHQHAL
jgi:hypothetical protein